MATTYDKASLVMIPSGYKDDKLYSIKPTDGSGDFTFSRDGAGASPATRVNASGLIEKGRENLLLQSNSFDTTWTNTHTTETGGQAGYDGTNDAWLIAGTGGGMFPSIQETITAFSGVVTFSVYAKAGTGEWINLQGGGSGSAYANFNLTTGAVGATTGTIIDTNAEDVGGGWWRLSITTNESARTTPVIYVMNANNDYAAHTKNIYIQDAQLEYGLVATDVIETTTTAVSAGLLGDMPRLDYSGGASCPSLLLEPSRTNLFQQSEYFQGGTWTGTAVTITNNYGTSPEGVQNSTRVVMDNLTSSRYAAVPSLTNGVTYTFSCWYKGTAGEKLYMEGQGVDGSGTLTNKLITFTGDWQREDLQFVGGSTSNLIYIVDSRNGTEDTAQDFEVYGAQVEAGSYPTSYIPTYGTATGRAEDAPSISSGSSIFNDNEGTFFLEIEGLSDSSSTKVVTIGDGTSNNRVQIFYQAGTNITTNVISGGSSQVTGFTTTADQEANHKVLVRYASNNAKMYLDGVEIASDVSVTPPSGLNVLRFNNGTGSAEFEGEVKQLLYFDTALTDAECIALTTL